MRQRLLFSAHNGTSDDIQVQPANRPVVLMSHALYAFLLVHVNQLCNEASVIFRPHTILVLLCCNALSIEIFTSFCSVSLLA